MILKTLLTRITCLYFFFFGINNDESTTLGFTTRELWIELTKRKEKEKPGNTPTSSLDPREDIDLTPNEEYTTPQLI